MLQDFPLYAYIPAKDVARARRFVLPGAVLIAFVVFFFLTFPFETLARRIETEAARSGLELTIERLGGAFLGVEAQGFDMLD